MAKKEQSKTCPACGTRNKAKWDFCVRCGESLQAVAASEEAPAKPQVVISDSPDEERSSMGGGIAAIALVLIAAGVTLWWVQRTPPASATPETSAFQIATVPSAPPSGAAAASTDPGLSAAKTAVARGDFGSALSALEAMVKERPSDPEVQSQYAQALLQAGRRDEALPHFEEAARLAPTTIYRLGFAAALNQAGRTQPAIEQYQLVLSSEPRNEQALKELGSLMNRAGRFDQAAIYLTQSLEVRPTDLVVQQDLAWAQEASGNLDAAAATYRKVLDGAPQATVSRGRLAEVLLKQEKLDEALSVVEEGLRREQAPILKRARASLLERSGKIAEAIAEYRDYARVAPNADDARLMLERAALLEKRAAGSS